MISLLQVPSTGHKQPIKIQGMSPSPALTTHTPAPPVADSPQPSQSPVTLSQQIQSPHQQQQPLSSSQPSSQTPSRSGTPLSHPPLFIIHNQIADPAQTASQSQPQPTQPQAHIQVQPQPRPPSQPAPFQQEIPPVSQSPKPPAASAVQHQFPAPPVSTSNAVVKTQIPIQGLTTEQQQHLQLVGAQIQTLSGITQPSLQQKQLLEKLHQVPSHHQFIYTLWNVICDWGTKNVSPNHLGNSIILVFAVCLIQLICLKVQQSILLQAKQPAQPQAISQFSSQQDVPADKLLIASSDSTGNPAQLPSVLQPTSVLVKTPVTGRSLLKWWKWQDQLSSVPPFPVWCDDRLSFSASNDLQVFSGAQGTAGAIVNQTVTSVSLTQPTQVNTAPAPQPHNKCQKYWCYNA